MGHCYRISASWLKINSSISRLQHPETLPSDISGIRTVATFQGSVTVNTCGEVDNSCVFTVSFPSFSVEQMHTSSNALIPLREKN